jgi:hypothetical protein
MQLYHLPRNHDDHEIGETYSVESNGTGTSIVVVMTHVYDTSRPPDDNNREERYEITGHSLAQLIKQYGKRVDEAG